MIKLRSAALTDIGCIRSENEDSFILEPAAMIFGIADGIGGLPGGAEASLETVQVIVRELLALPPGTAPDLTTIVHTANRAVIKRGREISPVMGIGSTLTFACVHDHAMHFAHVGDSRAYIWREGTLQNVTEDHSVENEARLRRARGEIVHYHEANRAALTRCIGQPTPPDVDLVTRPLIAGDRYLFCTDGVTRMIGDRELAQLMGQLMEPDALAREIVLLAVRRGGPDNATAVVVVVEEA
ncbi:MAG: serine/threonine-protein phosphatase [Undibacterium sp.]|nr:serine/threonine-protein phosphatase [Opitutaceae bacterium]